MSLVVAIDGPAGSGKSSVSRAAARRLGFDFLDTGAAYRALTWWCLQNSVDLEHVPGVLHALERFDYRTTVGADGAIVEVDGEDVTAAIREPRISSTVSLIARVPEVRLALNAKFREIIAATVGEGIVVEGRDITTVVAPDAGVRILLTADEQVRIARRAAELPGGSEATAAQLRERDARDSTVVDFMTAAEGVTTLDSTPLSFDETVEAVIELVNRAR